MAKTYTNFNEMFHHLRGKVVEIKPKEYVPKAEPKEEVKEEPKAEPKPKKSRKKKEN